MGLTGRRVGREDLTGWRTWALAGARYSRRRGRARAADLLDAVGLARRPTAGEEYSGGMRRRIYSRRATRHPRTIFIDGPLPGSTRAAGTREEIVRAGRRGTTCC